MNFRLTKDHFFNSLGSIAETKLRKSVKIQIEDDFVCGSIDICDEQMLFDLLHTDLWPHALPESAIARSPKQRFHRALSILGGDCMCRDYVFSYDDTHLEGPSFFPDHPLYRKSFIDFGCGDGLCVDIAKQYSDEVFGYDIQKHDDWNLRQTRCTDDLHEIQKAGPFEVALLYDVLDHAQRPNILLAQLNSILTDGATVYVRCHPWSSIHGGHLYPTFNKAFAHWILPQQSGQGQAVPIVDPLNIYPRLFEQAGFGIESTFIQPIYVNLLHSADIAKILTNKIYNGLCFAVGQYHNSTWFEFVDYKLKKLA